MISSKDDSPPARRPRFQSLLNRAKAAGDLLETTEAAGRLGQLELPRFSASDPLVINGRNPFERVRQQIHKVFYSLEVSTALRAALSRSFSARLRTATRMYRPPLRPS